MATSQLNTQNPNQLDYTNKLIKIADVRRTGVYSSKIPSGPINFKNHPDAAGIKSNPQLYANTYNAAFRIDNKTYKPQ